MVSRKDLIMIGNWLGYVVEKLRENVGENAADRAKKRARCLSGEIKRVGIPIYVIYERTISVS